MVSNRSCCSAPQGLSEAVIREIDRALAAHELIKVRVPGDEREAREALFAERSPTALARRACRRSASCSCFYRPLPEAAGHERTVGREGARRAERAPRAPATAAPKRARPAQGRSAVKPARATTCAALEPRPVDAPRRARRSAAGAGSADVAGYW